MNLSEITKLQKMDLKITKFRIIVSLLFIGQTIYLQGQTTNPAYFITTWNTEAGDTGSNSIRLPIVSGAYDVDYNNDGDFDDFGEADNTDSITIVFGSAGTHTIVVRPNPTNNTEGELEIDHNDSGSTPLKLTSIDQWGTIVWKSSNGGRNFLGCSNMTIASGAGAPNLTMVTTTHAMFANCTNLTGDLSGWDLSNVTDTSVMFAAAAAFTSDLSSWNLSSTNNTRAMFRDASSFDSDLSGWDVSLVTDMSQMFRNTIAFDQNIGSWDVSNVTTMRAMFGGSSALSTQNYDAILRGWSRLRELQSNVTLNVAAKYCNQAARDLITSRYSWNIADTGRGANCPVTPALASPIMSYSGNGNMGSTGMLLGEGSISFNDNGTTISCRFTKGGGQFLSDLIIYIDSKSGGFGSTTTFDDTSEFLTIGISGYTGAARSVVTFPTDFTADYAIAMSPRTGRELGGLWELSETGPHTYITSVNLSPDNNTASATYTFDFDFADIGTDSGNNFQFVATLIGDSNAARYGGAIGDGGSGTGIVDITFTGARTYPNTWTGTTDSDWATETNWTGGVPVSTHNVLIPSTTNQPAISTGIGVTVNKGVMNTSASLTMSSGASLIATSTFSGDITYHRLINHVTGNQAGWYLMASPVAGQTYNSTYVTANGIALSSSELGIGTYNTSTSSWDYLQSTGSGTFASGQGYAIKKHGSAGAISFTGTLNVDDAGVDVTLTNTATDRFNLLGNPYPSYLNSATFLASEAAISGSQTLWVWNYTLSTNGAYEVKNATEPFIIAPGQGFFVKTNTGGGTFNFSEANQGHSDTDTFQKSTKTQVKLDISDGNIHNYCKIYYLPETTAGFDVGYDGELFGGAPNPFAIYTHLVSDSEGKHYQIQSLPYSDIENMVIPVGINAPSGKEITIAADVKNFPAGVHLYLEDKLENSFTQLDKSDAKYTITLSDNLEGIGRFFLRASSSDLGDFSASTSLENISVYTSSKNNLRIVGIQEGNVKLRAYNILGAQIINTSFKANGKNDVAIPSLATGIYIVHLEMATGKVSRKVVVE